MKTNLSIAKYSMAEYDSSASGEVVCYDFSNGLRKTLSER
jgi:hypothetical protein